MIATSLTYRYYFKILPFAWLLCSVPPGSYEISYPVYSLALAAWGAAIAHKQNLRVKQNQTEQIAKKTSGLVLPGEEPSAGKFPILDYTLAKQRGEKGM